MSNRFHGLVPFIDARRLHVKESRRGDLIALAVPKRNRTGIFPHKVANFASIKLFRSGKELLNSVPLRVVFEIRYLHGFAIKAMRPVCF